MVSRHSAAKSTTPHGPNVRYTVRLHVVGDDLREDGSVRAADRQAELRVVTPFGELKAAALAAASFCQQNPRSIYREIEVVGVEHDFDIEPGDYRDRDSVGR